MQKLDGNANAVRVQYRENKLHRLHSMYVSKRIGLHNSTQTT